ALTGGQRMGGQVLNSGLNSTAGRCMMPAMDRPLGDLIGNSPQIEALRERVVRLLERQREAHRLPPVLIEGETGTGKGLLARMVRRLGSTRDEPIDVWLITATNEDLRQAIRRRRFREDLYHRLAVVTLTLPPLRERGADIVKLADHFLTRACADYGISERRLSEQARAALLRYPWPGNVRELANLMERL